MRKGYSLSVAESTMLPRPNGLASLIEGVILSWGWRRRAIAFISGAAGALALPPFSIFPLIAIPLAVAVWLIDGAQDYRAGRPLAASLRAAFGAGWWMGFGYFLAGLWWIGSALLVEADKFAWALPLAVVALPAVLAIFPAAGFALARLLWSPGPMRIFALAFGLGLAEWARGLLFTGFPWNDLGMALGVNLALAQTASLVGLHGLTFLTIAIFAAPATLWRVSDNRFDPAPTNRRGACARSACRLWRVPADGAPERDLAGGETAPHPAQRRPGRQHFRPAKQPSDHAPLFRPFGARDLARSIRNSRRYAPDLARVRLFLSFWGATRWRFPRSSTF